MCGRFTLTAASADLEQLIPGLQIQQPLTPRYNIAPSQPIPTVLNQEPRRLRELRWGLIPRGSKDPALGSKLINARAETLSQKFSFRDPFRRQRCLVLADGFYEWKAQGRHKVPHYIHLQNHRPFAFAGLWDRWRDPQGQEILSVVIITTRPNAIMQPIHSRMPMILSPQHYDLWLSADPLSSTDCQELQILQPYPAETMQAYPVSPQVNSPRIDRPECIQPQSQLTLFSFIPGPD